MPGKDDKIEPAQDPKATKDDAKAKGAAADKPKEAELDAKEEEGKENPSGPCDSGGHLRTDTPKKRLSAVYEESFATDIAKKAALEKLDKEGEDTDQPKAQAVVDKPDSK